MNPGTRQDRRLPPALGPSYFSPDELGLAQRIRATLEHAGRLAFIDPRGLPAGDWGEALERDESVLLADIAVYPMERERDAFLGALSYAEPEALMKRLWVLVSRVDRWHQLLRSLETPDGQALARAFAEEIEGRLAEPLRLCLRRHGHAPGGPGSPSPESLSSSWGLGGKPAGGQNPSADRDPRADRENLRNAVLGIVQSVGALRGLALERLASSLRSGRHDPSMGLLLAFLQLHGRAQQPLNRFTECLTDFYYQDILGMRPRPAALEKAYLLLDVEPTHGSGVLIEKGLRFAGGRDATGAAIEFVADQACPLSNARVAALRTLSLERDPLISPERELGFASRVKSRRLPLEPFASANGPAPEAWPLFGGGGGRSEAAQAQDARLGFAVSSPLFELKEGERELMLALHLSHPMDRDAGLRELLKSPPAEPAEWLGAVFARCRVLDEDSSPEPGGAAEQARQALLRSKTIGDPYLRFLAASCLERAEPQGLSERLGLLFTAWLTASSDQGLPPEDLAALRSHARGVLGRSASTAMDADDPLSLIFGDRPLERALVFDQVFRGLWKAKVSTAAGWLNLDEVFCRFRDSAAPAPGQGGCIELLIRVGAAQPALCPCVPALHGSEWPAQAMVQLELQNQTRVFGYTLLSRLEWREMELSVAVQGLRDVQIHNQMGRLDPGKPFQPFGPLPEVGSYFIVGSAEMAAKPLRNARVRLEWGKLPREEGGFEQHYGAYPGRWEAGAFRVRFDILRDGQWQPGQAGLLRLFATLPPGRRVASACVLELDPLELRRHFRPVPVNGDPAVFEYGPRARNGFFRFELAEPAAAFGHALYNRLLTETLTRNARLKRQDPLPAEPYTPVMQWLQVDYQAVHSLYPGQDTDAAGLPGEAPGLHKVFHLYPFGQEEIHPGRGTGRHFLLPRIAHRGNLYIGLRARDPRGPISLFFHLRQEDAGEPLGETRGRVRWSVWRPDGWSELPPQQVVSDGTLGFLRSGIVCLDLPEGMSRDCPNLAGGGEGASHWLRLSADSGLDGFAALYGVHVNAVCVSRVQAPGRDNPDRAPLPPGTIHTPLRNVAGLRKALQAGPTFGLRAPDSREQVLIRSAERLRHKGRASMGWDYERLLLDAFPGLFRVRAFPQRAEDGDPRKIGSLSAPGQVLVAVVPAPGAPEDPLAAPRFDAATLERMAEHLRRAASPQARIVVRNAAYERIQVRCAVSLAKGVHPGAGLRRLNAVVVRFISPWSDEGRGFGWELRAEVLEARLRSLDEVESVGGLSFLHLADNARGFHSLEDSARRPKKDPGAWSTLVRPELPWSLALPTPGHLIEAVERLKDVNPSPTGIDRLEIGNTFIINGPIHDE